jgi:hypothetical protein
MVTNKFASADIMFAGGDDGTTLKDKLFRSFLSRQISLTINEHLVLRVKSSARVGSCLES